MAKKIPTLTPKGFVDAIADKGDAAMVNFYVSQYSQSNLYRGSNRPLAYLVQQYGSNSIAMAEALEIELTSYLNRLFDFASIEAEGTEDGDRINLRIDVIIRDDGKEYSLGHEIMTANSKIIDVIDINNTGSLLRANPAILKD